MDMTFFRAALLGACVLLSGCDSATTPATPTATATVLDGKTMGTFWRVSVIGVDDEAKAQALRAKVQAQLDADDRLLSTWKNDSALMRFNHAATTEPWPVSEAMADIVTLSLRIGAKTHGAMDITVGPLGQPVGLWPG
ncbi:thiamine biosynthesis lipoprotein ApbE [Klebsiella pneumoniae subsp. ozaenae]|uniref:FAD:protein FMN transferase n=1 Tax=Klebsiella pneumoniae subsp. ozaenae TaxID=574 RepID=A0A377ZAQ1_KLEPO|nr:thiamine biosynthesis lipoprotein ApbE [Klebsiella pneumoniae subsp. ozaenae]